MEADQEVEDDVELLAKIATALSRHGQCLPLSTALVEHQLLTEWVVLLLGVLHPLFELLELRLHRQLDMPLLRLPRVRQLRLARPLALAAEQRLDALVGLVHMARDELLRHRLKQRGRALHLQQAERTAQPQRRCDCHLTDACGTRQVRERGFATTRHQAAHERLALSENRAAQSITITSEFELIERITRRVHRVLNSRLRLLSELAQDLQLEALHRFSKRLLDLAEHVQLARTKLG